jgi:ABC-type phosphate/phosphonate transport system substrate-binding protein
MHALRTQNVNLSTINVTRYDKDVGKHGDTAVGEIDVIEALRNGNADAGFVSKLMFDRRDISHPRETELSELKISVPPFDHCQFDALDTLSSAKQFAFQRALSEMDWNSEKDRKIMELEGIKRSWMPTREQGYDIMRAATEEELNVVFPPPVHTEERHPFKSLCVVSQ